MWNATKVERDNKRLVIHNIFELKKSFTQICSFNQSFSLKKTLLFSCQNKKPINHSISFTSSHSLEFYWNLRHKIPVRFFSLQWPFNKKGWNYNEPTFCCHFACRYVFSVHSLHASLPLVMLYNRQLNSRMDGGRKVMASIFAFLFMFTWTKKKKSSIK